MPDITGRIYEAFTEFLLKKMGYRDEWTSGSGRKYLYEPPVQARCHQQDNICLHARQCSDFSQRHEIDYGPWHDPDFIVLDNDQPVACLHVTHWSNPRDSHRKFWRTMEDHLQYKTFFGKEFISLSLIFVALDQNQPVRLVRDSAQLVLMHGWSPANGSALAVGFDSSLLFPKIYCPLERYVDALPEQIQGTPRRRRTIYNQTWENLYESDVDLRTEIDHVCSLLRDALEGPASDRYPTSAIQQLQHQCWTGRQRAVGLRPTYSRYRKGIQHAFILRELIARYWQRRVDPDAALWHILQSDTRIRRQDFGTLLGLPVGTSDEEIQAFIDVLAAIPVQMERRSPSPLLNPAGGIGIIGWHTDFSSFIDGLRQLEQDDLKDFRTAVEELYTIYRNCYGIEDVLADLANPQRVQLKIDYVASHYLNITNREVFVNALAADMLTPASEPEHQTVVRDLHNWVGGVLLEFYDIGSMQHITTSLPERFESIYNQSLRNYSFNRDPSKLVSHLLAGVPIGQFFSNGTQLNEADFYSAIWPLFAECFWEAIQGRTPLSPETAATNYRYTKAMRIISSPDLEPIKFLFQRNLPHLENGPTLRGAFNQLCTQRGWSRTALTTQTSGQDPESGAIIQTQAVVGGNGGQIGHKTRELAGRLRSVHLRCEPDGTFSPEPNPGIHYLVLDGDWPVESKINLLEAGFSGIFEIAELERLSQELDDLNR